MNVAGIAIWMFVPTLACAAMSATLIKFGYVLLGYAILVCMATPVALLFTVYPVLAWVRKDHLRTCNVDSASEDSDLDER